VTDASLQPHWLTDPQAYAVEQERQRHLDALYAYGEFAMFVLMWRVTDFEAGLVGRCPTCFTSGGKIAATYGQGAKRDCPDCFGTTFEGGYRAKIVRPSLWDHDTSTELPGRRGDTITEPTRIQTTGDFNSNTDDYAFRGDGTRWQMRNTDWDLLRTGFQTPSIPRTLLGWNITQANLEDPSSVAYLIPPTGDELVTILNVTNGLRFPPDFSEHEDIRGPLA
jgi:hypothetical protein